MSESTASDNRSSKRCLMDAGLWPKEQPAANVYRVRLFCSDCTGTDPDGCFGGSSELLHGKTRPWPVLTFTEIEDAKATGYAEVANCGPWGFEVINEDDEVVYATDA